MLATTIHKSNTTPHHQNLGRQQPHSLVGSAPQPRGITISGFPQRDEEIAGLLSQSPIVCLMIPSPENPAEAKSRSGSTFVVHQNHTHYRCGPSTDSPTVTVIRDMRAGRGLVVLLRKEVIQPHLPVRLPCYDFVPIADPTFDGSLPEGLGHRLRVLPTFMT